MNKIWISIIEGIKIAFVALSANKMRAILTTACIVIGIVSVTTMNTVTDGVDRSFDESMDMLGRNVVFVEKWPWGIGGGEYKWWEYRNRPDMQLSYVDEIKNRSRLVSEVSAVVTRNTMVRYIDRELRSVPVSGVTSGYSTTASVDIEDGRFFSEDEEQRRANVAIIGGTVAEALFPDVDPLGKQIRMRGQRFTVIGVMAKKGNFLGVEDTDNRIIIPISSMQQIFSIRFGIQLSVQFPTEEIMEEGEYELIGVMRQIRQLDPMAENDFAINKSSMFEEQFKSMKIVIYGIGIFLTGLALFVGGIGVMNIMFVSVKERTKEIGIRKAVGAKSWEILFQFLIEAIVICCIGGLIGMLFSLGITQIINQFFIAYMDWGTVFNAFLICALIGLLFGYLPSRKAANSDPIDSLRYE